jgi:diacylglycerol kinase family enzyme
VIALGGDGTINEVANGVLGEACAIAPLPGGSTNVFARAIGYPNDPIEATGVLLEALAGGQGTMASVGLANARAFLFHCGAGFDAAVVARVERRGQLKRYASHPLFIASAFSTWMRDAERRRGGFQVEASDGRAVSGVKMMVALNTSPYTYLGHQPMNPAPEAGLEVPLSILALTSLSPRMAPVVVRALRRPGGLADRGAAHHWTGIQALTVTSPRPFPYQLDGEVMEPVAELRLTHRPDAIRLVTPYHN